jgi:hypothetical protein
MKNLYTKSEIARILHCDIRCKQIRSLTPVAKAIMGKKEVSLFELPPNE